MAKALLAVAATAAVGVAAFVFTTVVSKQSSQSDQSRKQVGRERSSEESRKEVGADCSPEGPRKEVGQDPRPEESKKLGQDVWLKESDNELGQVQEESAPASKSKGELTVEAEKEGRDNLINVDEPTARAAKEGRDGLSIAATDSKIDKLEAPDSCHKPEPIKDDSVALPGSSKEVEIGKVKEQETFSSENKPPSVERPTSQATQRTGDPHKPEPIKDASVVMPGPSKEVESAKVKEQEAALPSVGRPTSEATQRAGEVPAPENAKVEKREEKAKNAQELPSIQKPTSENTQKAEENQIPRKGSGMAELVEKKVPASSRAPETPTLPQTNSSSTSRKAADSSDKSATLTGSPPKAQVQAPSKVLSTGAQQLSNADEGSPPPNPKAPLSNVLKEASSSLDSSKKRSADEPGKQVAKAETKPEVASSGKKDAGPPTPQSDSASKESMKQEPAAKTQVAASEKKDASDASPPKSSSISAPASKGSLKQEAAKTQSATSPPAKGVAASSKSGGASEGKQVQGAEPETEVVASKEKEALKSASVAGPASKEPSKQEPPKTATSAPAKGVNTPSKIEAFSTSDEKLSAEKQTAVPASGSAATTASGKQEGTAKSLIPKPKSEVTSLQEGASNNPPKVEASSVSGTNLSAEKQVAPQAWGNAATTVSKVQEGTAKSLIPKPKAETAPSQEEASNNGVANKRSFASLTKPSPNPAPQRTSIGSYADMAKPVSAKTSKSNPTSPPDDRSRFGFVAKLPKLATSPPQSRSQSVASTPKPAEVQVGFEPAKPASRPLSPSAPAFVPGQKPAESKVEEGQKLAAGDTQISSDSDGKADTKNGVPSKIPADGQLEEGQKLGAKDAPASNNTVVKAEDKNGGAGLQRLPSAKAFYEGQSVSVGSQPAAKASPTKPPVKPTIDVGDLQATNPGSAPSSPSDGSHSPKDDVTTDGEAGAMSNGVTPVGSPTSQKPYVEAVVWNADKTRKNKAKRDKKKAKKSRSAATSPTREGPNAK